MYKTWITPIKKSTLHNTGTGLGGFSNRVGALAYALTPLTVVLSTRESILALATGIPYQSFNFLHRWLGRVIFIQSFLHTLGWTLIEGRFYQPQPSTYKNFIKQTYMIWGCIAMLFITFLFIFSLRRIIKWTGHEFIRKTHYVVACLYLGACWGHWNQLACWMIASLGVFGIDRCVRLLRTLFIHTGYQMDRKVNFPTLRDPYEGDRSLRKIRNEQMLIQTQRLWISFPPTHQSDTSTMKMEAWEVGQHFFLCFPAFTIWQSHPLTVASVLRPHPYIPHHTYIIRCRNGETRRLKTLALSEDSTVTSRELGPDETVTTPVILCGPYGTGLLPSSRRSREEVTNILAVAGGTGVSPVILAATSNPAFDGAAIDFVWIIRRKSNTQWISVELEEVKRRTCASKHLNFRIHIYVTQEHGPNSTATLQTHLLSEDKARDIGIEPFTEAYSFSSRSEKDSESPKFKITYLNARYPSLQDVVSRFIETRSGFDYRTRVIASGPAGMGYDLRVAVAMLNDGGKVWKGERRCDVDLHWDDRMG